MSQWGAPERVYCDNGQIYTSDRLTTVLARLGARVVHTPPYQPAGQGYAKWRVMQSGALKPAPMDRQASIRFT